MVQQCQHLAEVQDVAPQDAERMRGVPQDRHALGAPAPVPGVRARRLLRQSQGKHATKHFHATQHPIMRSFEPGEDWSWCYVDEVFFEPALSAGKANEE